ncbi:hypothetical protein BURKHO8Y_10258 [Burkholderia sp. 8Y]|nr:hypothetical protein BURKHO8Y_10258 [Burkholderia sp. 8Y]
MLSRSSQCTGYANEPCRCREARRGRALRAFKAESQSRLPWHVSLLRQHSKRYPHDVLRQSRARKRLDYTKALKRLSRRVSTTFRALKLSSAECGGRHISTPRFCAKFVPSNE